MAGLCGCFSRRLATVVLLCVLHACSSALGQARSEREVKALFFVTLARYVEWPTNAFASPTAPLTIGVLGEDPFGNLLESLVHGEEVRGRPLKLVRFASAEGAKDCHLLFVGRMAAYRFEFEMDKLKKFPVATVSDRTGFVGGGGVIEMFINDEKKVRLKISRSAVQRTGITVSPALLSLAELVASMEYVPDVPFTWLPATRIELLNKLAIARKTSV